MKFLERFSKFNQTFVYKLFSVGDRHYDSKLTVLVRHYKFAAHLQKTSEISVLTDSGVDITLLFSGTHAVNWLTQTL
jgi:hypothetical protein